MCSSSETRRVAAVYMRALCALTHANRRAEDAPTQAAVDKVIKSATVASTNMEATLDHVALAVHNPMQLVQFYSNVLGFATERVSEYESGKVPFPSIRINSSTIVDFIPNAKEGDVRSGHFCIALQEKQFEELRERLRQNNIQTGEPKLRYGARGQGWALYVDDPEQNTLEFRWYP